MRLLRSTYEAPARLQARPLRSLSHECAAAAMGGTSETRQGIEVEGGACLGSVISCGLARSCTRVASERSQCSDHSEVVWFMRYQFLLSGSIGPVAGAN